MKRILTTTILFQLMLGALVSSAQSVTDYYSWSFAGNYIALGNPTTLVAGNFDDQVYVITGLPAYQFNGVSYTELTVSGNGCAIPGNLPNPGILYQPISDVNNAPAVISPLGRDLQSATSASSISYEVVDDEIVVQWQEAKRFGATGESFDFQLHINIYTNTIQFVYGSFTNLVNNGGVQVGLRGATNADYLNRSVEAGMCWSGSIAGVSNASTCLLNNQPCMSPVSGWTIVYTPCTGTWGCMDESACNFNAEATCSADNCDYCSCDEGLCGCTDMTACNFNADAWYDNGTCSYDCYGCMNVDAINYDADATMDDGSCILPGSGLGCQVPMVLTCANNVILGTTNGITVDTSLPDGVTCGNVIADVGFWYIYEALFSSTMTISTSHSYTDFDTYLQVLTGNCNELTCLGFNDDGGGSLTSLMTFEAVAGETYFIRVAGFGGQSGNYGLTFDCGGGCLDPEACNYDADAPFDNGSCLFGEDCYGCTDSEANNYDPEVVYDNGSCTYSIDLVVFYDMNMDGERQWNEPGMSNWPLYIGGLQATLFTNANGRVDVSVPASPFLVELQNTTDNWVSTTPSEQMVMVPSTGETLFGLAPSTGEAFVLAGPIDGFWDIIHCTEGREDGIYINNTGSVPLNGTITMICDEMFTPEADALGTIAPDATGPGFAQWNIFEMLPGQNQLFSFHIDGPGFDVIGDDFNFLFDVVLYDEEGVEFFNTEYEVSAFVACSYDPNDITATPEGYEEPHFILSGERIQYRVRFQNTGNLPAEDVVIIDELDPTVFDMSTFVPLYGSDSFTSCLHDDGTLDFIFNEINLPDSASDEAGSHGFVVFSVELQPGLAPGTVINNYADIYFEQNPAITTNTVFHTIFDCGSFVIPTISSEYCSNDAVAVDNTQMYVESYSWILDNETVVTEPQADWNNLALGAHQLEWSVENPLCGMEGVVNFDVLASPVLTMSDDVEVCVGTVVTLNATSNAPIVWSEGMENGATITIENSEVFIATATSENGCQTSAEWNATALELPSAEVIQSGDMLFAMDGVAWQWYFNGAEIVNAITSGLSTDSEGVYSVLVTNAEGCSSMSEDILVSSVLNADDIDILLFPQPVTGVSVLRLPTGKHVVDVVDASGRLVKSYGVCTGQINIEAAHYASGIYFVHVKNDQSTFTLKTIIE